MWFHSYLYRIYRIGYTESCTPVVLGLILFVLYVADLAGIMQCLKWSKKEAGSLPQAELECPVPRIFSFIFHLKMASFDAFLVVFYAI